MHDLHYKKARQWEQGEDPSYDMVIDAEDNDFYVHSTLLRINSPVFNAMLTHDCAEKTEKRVEIRDFTDEQIQAFLEQLYYGRASSISPKQISLFFPVAHKHMVNTLMQSSIDWLNENATPAFGVPLFTCVCVISRCLQNQTPKWGPKMVEAMVRLSKSSQQTQEFKKLATLDKSTMFQLYEYAIAKSGYI